MSAREPQVGIVILNWNGREVLRDCLRSVFALRYPRFEVIIVDNGSKDDSVAMLRREFPHCLLIENSTNRGFCEANNQGISLALSRGYRYTMILNNDTILEPNCLAFLVQRAESSSQIAAVSPKIYFANPPDRIWFGGGTFSYWKGRNGHLGHRERDMGQWNTPKEIEFVCGCAFLASESSWRRIGGFDERFFRSCEDADWSIRAKKAGLKLFYEPSSCLWHRESFDILRSEGQAGILYYWTRNNLLLMYKHGRVWHWLTFLPYFAVLTAKRFLISCKANDWAAARATLRGVRDFFLVIRNFRKEDPSRDGSAWLRELRPSRQSSD
jgi:GT2 family glycosyltransferase